MKASEMMNEDLARFFDELASFNRGDDKSRETAARLRKPCTKNFKCDSLGELLAVEQRKVDALRSKLKVAEGALEKITTGCFGYKDGDKPIVQVIIDIASNALFDIREEGDES